MEIKEYRCPRCNRKLLYLSGIAIANIKCPKCKSIVYIDTKNKVVRVDYEKEKEI